MDIIETINKIKSQLKEIESQEQDNQQEQARINQRIAELEEELQQQNQRRSELDREAIGLYSKAEELRPKLDKLERIANLSKEFLELHTECQDNQDLLNTLYSSISSTRIGDRPPISTDIHADKPANSDDLPQPLEGDRLKEEAQDNSYSDYSISIDEIKEALPNADKVYQQLVANYLEEYKTYQNYIIDGLDLTWYAVAFVAFGRSSYRKMSFKYHPDLNGSEMAMQLINTAWSISQNFLGDAQKEDVML